MDQYLIPAREARVEIRVVNSRFIATAAPVFAVARAKGFVDRVRHEFADATHNVSAYLVGHGRSVVAHCHDDGEPSGTAGRPALAVLQGSGLGDVAVVVTRYFGGTKLGTGGLVRAYGDAVRSVLNVLPRAAKVLTHTGLLVVPYAQYEPIRVLIQARRGAVLDQSFEAEVTLTVRFPVEQFGPFCEAVRELSSGTLDVQLIAANQITIMPLDETA